MIKVPVQVAVSKCEFSLRMNKTCEAAEIKSQTSVSRKYPDYTGPTVITPSEEKQVLFTLGTSVRDNIVVNPIPSNYGKVAWNGVYLTIS